MPADRVLWSYLDEAKSSTGRGDWRAARYQLLSAARLTDETTDLETVVSIGDALERLEEFQTAFRLLAGAGSRLRGCTEVEWDGRPVRGGPLLIEQRIRDLGAPIRQARVAVRAARDSRCQMLVNPRLSKLFSRSFPEVEILESGVHDGDFRSRASAVASLETLCRWLAPTRRAARSSFRPLAPEAGAVRAVRSRWKTASDGAPLIGISWGSTNPAKDLPDLASWAAFLSGQPAVFIALQHGALEGEAASLSAGGATVITDPEVQPLADLDVFASQIAALDGVVSISNTTAHLAGALGVRVVTILDDRPHLSWPVESLTSAWYPSMRLVRRRARDWRDVFVEVDRRLGLRRRASSARWLARR